MCRHGDLYILKCVPLPFVLLSLSSLSLLSDILSLSLYFLSFPLSPLPLSLELTCDFGMFPDSHAIAGALKLYFRELPIPLITFDCYELVLVAASESIGRCRGLLVVLGVARLGWLGVCLFVLSSVL